MIASAAKGGGTKMIDVFAFVWSTASSTKSKTLIFSSTAAVYSGNKNVSCSEKLKPKPTNVYGQTKFVAENLIRSFSKQNRTLKISLFSVINVQAVQCLLKNYLLQIYSDTQLN